MVKLLSPVKTATTIMCEEEQPTVSVIAPLQAKLLKHFTVTAEDSSVITEMKQAMAEDLEQERDATFQFLIHEAAELMIQKNDTVSQVENATAHSSADKTSDDDDDDDPEVMPGFQAEPTEEEHVPPFKKSKPFEDLFGDTFCTVDPSQTVKTPKELALAEVVKYRDTASLNLGGTQSVHHIEPTSWGLIKHSPYSSSEAATHAFHHSSEVEPQAHPYEPLGNIKTDLMEESEESEELSEVEEESEEPSEVEEESEELSEVKEESEEPSEVEEESEELSEVEEESEELSEVEEESEELSEVKEEHHSPMFWVISGGRESGVCGVNIDVTGGVPSATDSSTSPCQEEEPDSQEENTEAPGAYGIHSGGHAARVASYETASALASRSSPAMGMATGHTPGASHTGLPSNLQPVVEHLFSTGRSVVSTDALSTGWVPCAMGMLLQAPGQDLSTYDKSTASSCWPYV
ncbi:unnamed protein product [Leuciscus chuanchicus]